MYDYKPGVRCTVVRCINTHRTVQYNLQIHKPDKSYSFRTNSVQRPYTAPEVRACTAGMKAAKMPSLPVEPQPTGLPADPDGFGASLYPKAEASP